MFGQSCISLHNLRVDGLHCFVASQERDAHHERKLKDHIALDTGKTKSKRPNPEIIAATGLLVHESKRE